MRNAGLDEAQAEIKITGRNINNLRYADYTILFGRKWRAKGPLDENEEESEKAGLKFNIQKSKWHLIPSLHGKYICKQWKQWNILFSQAPKSLKSMIVSMKLKGACFLVEKLWQM